MPVSAKTYLLVAVGVGGLIFLIGLLFADGIHTWAQDKQVDVELDDIGVIFKPVELVFNPSHYYIGAVVAGLLWPITLIWIPLLILGLVVGPMIDATQVMEDAAGYIRFYRPF